jgi:hypothetical protein
VAVKEPVIDTIDVYVSPDDLSQVIEVYAVDAVAARGIDRRVAAAAVQEAECLAAAAGVG